MDGIDRVERMITHNGNWNAAHCSLWVLRARDLSTLTITHNDETLVTITCDKNGIPMIEVNGFAEYGKIQIKQINQH